MKYKFFLLSLPLVFSCVYLRAERVSGPGVPLGILGRGVPPDCSSLYRQEPIWVPDIGEYPLPGGLWPLRMPIAHESHQPILFIHKNKL